jgi:hypothetical protein
MNKIEMNRRLATLDEKVIEQVREMIRLGYGARGISLEAPASIKQINAVFALAQGKFA